MRNFDLPRTKISRAALLALLATAGGSLAQAADVTWTNGAGSFLWNTSAANWSIGAWSNSGNGAVFGPLGAGAINVTAPVSVNSLNFTSSGYTLNGGGVLSFVSGFSTAGTGFVNVDPGITASINTAVNSSLGLLKIGAGTLQLAGPLSFSGNGLPFFANGNFPMDLVVAGASNLSKGGTLQIMNSNVLPASTRAAISNGLLDIGNNDVTLGSLLFINQGDSSVWDPVTRSGGVGVIGNGTLRVTGDINVIGTFAGNQASNNIGANLDLGGGTQIIRTSINGSAMLGRALQISGTISNGSLLKTFGFTDNGVMGDPDGLALYGNNTYTGASIFNGGSTVVTGTNASTLVKVMGDRGVAGSTLTLQGANGSYLSATTIQATTGSFFVINNSAAITPGGDMPTIPAAQNNNRIRDDAEVLLRLGGFTYLGLAGATASETFGNLNVVGDHNVVRMVPGSGGTVTLTTSGDLLLAPRATLQITSTTLGGASKLFVEGALPAADATGILPRMYGGSGDFLTYNTSTGFTPLTTYATNFSTPGANVAITAASTVGSSVTINALKRTGTFTTTIAPGQTLGISSGMILNASGTGTFSGGTIAFGAVPGVFFNGSYAVSSALAGTAGLINADATLTLSGDLSGLSGNLTTTSTGNTTLSTNTFAGAIDVRGRGGLNITTSQTLVGQGAITIGQAENESDLVGSRPALSFAAAGANAVIGRDIIIDNGSQTAAGNALSFAYVPTLAPMSNATATQTLSGNITVNSPVRLQGGGTSTTLNGSTNLTGNIDGPSLFMVANGRANFSGNLGNAGGFRIGEGGFSAQVTFSGTTTGSAPVTLVGGNSTSLSYMPGSLPRGAFIINNSSGLSGFSATVVPLATSTIDNVVTLQGIATANVGAGIAATWNGPVGGNGALVKNGAGTLVLGNPANAYTGATTVNAGTLRVDGALASTTVNVAGTGTLGGQGNIASAVNVAAGGTLAPGSSVGTSTLGVGGLSLAGTFLPMIDLNGGGAASADLLDVSGFIGIASGAVLQLSLTDLPAGAFEGTFLLAANDGADAITGSFASVLGLPEGYFATIDYSFGGIDALGRIGTGNDLAVQLTAVPEPSSFALLAAGGALLMALRRRRTGPVTRQAG